MPLPSTIPVRFTEEEADYVSIRPVRRQTFQLRELLDMVLRVTGRDIQRVQQILRSGTLVFHFYRYWWTGFEADAAELASLFSEFPADDPSRAFEPKSCTLVVIEGGAVGRVPVEIERASAERKPLFASRSFWDCVLELALAQRPEYAGYSFERRADLYRVKLSAEQSAILLRDAARLAPRSLRAPLEALGAPKRVTFVCPRTQSIQH